MFTPEAAGFEFDDKSGLWKSHTIMMDSWIKFIEDFDTFMESGKNHADMEDDLSVHLSYAVDQYAYKYFDEPDNDPHEESHMIRFLNNVYRLHYVSLSEIIMRHDVDPENYSTVTPAEIDEDVAILFHTVNKQERRSSNGIDVEPIDTVEELVRMLTIRITNAAEAIAQQSNFVQNILKKDYMTNDYSISVRERITANATEIGRVASGVFIGLAAHSLAKKFFN